MRPSSLAVYVPSGGGVRALTPFPPAEAPAGRGEFNGPVIRTLLSPTGKQDGSTSPRFPLNHPPLRLTTFTPKVLVLLQQEQRSRTACPQSMGRSSYSTSCVLCPTAPLCSGESPACRPRAAWPGALSPCPPPSIASRSHSASPSISPFRAPAPHPRPGGPGAPVPARPPTRLLQRVLGPLQAASGEFWGLLHPSVTCFHSALCLVLAFSS